jgi:nucleoid DNA-binding protein
MNLTQIIEATGKRIRHGKLPADRLTNAEVKTVLETAIEVLKEGLLKEGRVEIQGFAVLEVRMEILRTNETTTTRHRWRLRPARTLKNQLQSHQPPAPHSAEFPFTD